MSSPTFELTRKIYRAGAGAGKTTSLVDEVSNFFDYYFQKNKKNPKVILTTFTRKATQEMRERLMVAAQSRADQSLLEFVMSKNQLHISTIHGVLQLFLKQYGYLMDLDPGFSIVTSSENYKNASRILKSIILKNKDYQQILEIFEFQDLVSHSLKFCDVFALDESATFPTLQSFENAIQVTFDVLQKSMTKIVDQIRSQTNDNAYLTFANQLEQLMVVLNIKQWKSESGQILNSIDLISKPRKSSKNPQVSDDVESLIKQTLEQIRELEEDSYSLKNWEIYINHYSKIEPLFKDFYKEFYLFKLRNGFLQMSDLEILSYRLLKFRPDVLSDFSEQWDYWLIDEYQDTSPLQVQILDTLIQDKPCFIVGDPQQSIYFFRGARKEVFDNKQTEIVANHGILKNLSVNYRSFPELMSFINELFRPLNFMKMTAHKKSASSGNPAAIFVSNSSVQDEIKSIVNYILDLSSKGVSWEDIAIITRKNSELKEIASELAKNQIPYFLNAASGFNFRREIIDALALLKFLVHPFDNMNLIMLLRSPWFHVSDKKLSSVLTHETPFWLTLLKEALPDDEELSAISVLKKYMDDCQAMGISRVFEKALFESGILDCSYMYDPSGRREANLWKLIVQLKQEEHRPGFNYIKFINDFLKNRDLPDEESDAVSSVEPQRINLMTVHVSKGLEFKHVILPFINKAMLTSRSPSFLFDPENNFWSVALKQGDSGKSVQSLPAQVFLEKNKLEEIEESKRLLYVAVTRAKESIFFSYTGDAKKNSWLSQISLNLSEGVHAGMGFTYKVLSEYHDIPSVKPQAEPKKIRPVYKPTSEWIYQSANQSITLSLREEVSQTPNEKFQSLKNAQHGIQIHRLFELLHYEGEEKTLEIAKKWSPDKYEYFSKSLISIKKQNHIPLLEIIKSGHVEWGFVLKGKLSARDGQVDLWGVVDDTLWVVDYKTGNPAHVEKAFQQLEFYSLAVQTFLGPKKTKLCVVFPGEGKMPVRESAPLEKLKEQLDF